MKLKNDRLRIFFKILIIFLIIYTYIALFINTSIHKLIESEINSRFNIKKINIKDKILFNSLNKVVSINDLENINNVKSVNSEIKEDKIIVNESISLKPIIYIYNSHDTEKYSLPFVSDYSITPDVKLSSYILKDHLNTLKIGSTVEKRSISSYLKEHKLDYLGCYEASRYYIKTSLKDNDYKILLDIHRDSVKRKYTLYENNDKKYAKVMFVLTTKHKNYKKNEKFATYLNSKINSKYKGLSRGIMKRKDVIFNQDLSGNSILIEVGGVDNTIDEINNTLEVLADILSMYIKENKL